MLNTTFLGVFWWAWGLCWICFFSKTLKAVKSKTQLLSALWFCNIWDCDFLCLFPKCQSLHSQWYICSNKCTESLNWQHLVPSSMAITHLRVFYHCRNSPVTTLLLHKQLQQSFREQTLPRQILMKGDVPFPVVPNCVQKIPVLPDVYVTVSISTPLTFKYN